MPAKYSPAPWSHCGSKGHQVCQCHGVWSKPSNHPVCVVEHGKWGDHYPALRVVKEDGDAERPSIDSINAKVEAFEELIEYGEISLETSEANVFLITAAPELLEALQVLTLAVESQESYADQETRIIINAALGQARHAIKKALGEVREQENEDISS